MVLRPHTITVDQVRALADGTSTAAETDLLIAGQFSKCGAMLALVARMAARAGHPEASAAVSGWQLLTRVQRSAPQAVGDVLRYPTVGAWAAATVAELGSASPARAQAGRLALVAAAAAIRAGVRFSIGVPPSARVGAAVHIPSLGTAALGALAQDKSVVLSHHRDATELAGGHGTILLPHPLGSPGPAWRPLPAVIAGSGRTRLLLLIEDADPYRLTGDDRPAGQLTASQAGLWRRRIRGGWRLLARDHGPVAAEMLALVGALMPLTGQEGAVRSVTTRQLFGGIGLSLPADDVGAAVTLAHEVQHLKLAALMDLLPLVSASASALYYAPWRTDPRPLASLLQGVYAHLGVARFWHRQARTAGTPAEVHHAYVEFARWRNACTQVANVLSARQELTECGHVFVDGMLRALRGLRDDPVPPAAEAAAGKALLTHRLGWEARHGTARGRPSAHDARCRAEIDGGNGSHVASRCPRL